MSLTHRRRRSASSHPSYPSPFRAVRPCADTVRILTADLVRRAWEHPADRAALNALRAIPGFDEVVRKIAGFFGERGVRQLFLAQRRSGRPAAAPEARRAATPKSSRRWTGRSGRELYVAQTPTVNAMAVGFEKPFIVINSGLLELLDRDEQRAILAHELGHIMSGHTTYTHDRAHPAHDRPARTFPSSPASRCSPSSSRCSSGTARVELSTDRAGLLSGRRTRPQP